MNGERAGDGGASGGGEGGAGAGGGAGGGRDPEVEDEFACAGMLRGALGSLHRTVERLFGVRFVIGADADATNGDDGQMWLKLQGRSHNVTAAKLFVKGLVNQEEQMEVSYPRVLHCVFCGARGLFMDCLVRSTSAHIVVGSPGSLLISGLAEPVVRAYSLITDLVDRYEDTQPRHADAGDRAPGESLDSRRTFKTLVERWDDMHILDLLVLPGSVKEILLDLVKDSGFGSSHSPSLMDGNEGERSRVDSGGRWDEVNDRWVDGVTAFSPSKHSLDQSLSASEGARGGAGVAKETPARSPQEVGEEEQPEPTAAGGAGGAEVKEEQEQQLSVGNKEFWLLLKFFTAMGYTEDVVKRVLARTGPKEASQILDLVQQEQDLSDRKQTNQQREKNKEVVASNRIEKNRPCETEHREDEEMSAKGDKEVCDGATGGSHEEEGGAEDKEEAQEEDFVLGVLKKAAASCGYTEQNVAKLYNMLPEHSTHQLLLELQREVNKDKEALREEPKEMDDVVLEKGAGETELFTPAVQREAVDDGWVEVTNNRRRADKPTHPPTNQHKPQNPQQIVIPQVKGPPVPTYPSSLNPPIANFQPNKQYNQPILWSSPDDELLIAPLKSNSLKRALQAPQPPIFTASNPSPARSRDQGRGFVTTAAAAAAPSVVVTGEQRFLEGLQAPFNLQLTDKPGDAKLRTIIIDGSNVAMSHGLGHFFSCRGIALAVQHFWDRGHRHISVFLPQWRQKSDPQNKEQHYLTELQKVGLLSYTPSREVQGKRISSYDDRFMLQLAQKTNGVIVTNDNLRDLSDESPVWRDIIKKRLLQYTFVGDHFMVPDDPLGRGGPHLDVFLRSDHRTPDVGNHSFAGLANTITSSKAPRSQTEVLNFRDRTLGGSVDTTRGGGGRTRGRGGPWKGWGHQQGPAKAQAAERSPEETSALREQLCQVFVGQDSMVALVLQCHPAETDLNVLSDLMLEQERD